MLAFLSLWWVWVSAALVFAVVELLLPAFVFLGFALGALIMAVAVFALPMESVPAMLALFGGLSLASWIILRLLFRRTSGGARIVHRDINEG